MFHSSTAFKSEQSQYTKQRFQAVSKAINQEAVLHVAISSHCSYLSLKIFFARGSAAPFPLMPLPFIFLNEGLSRIRKCRQIFVLARLAKTLKCNEKLSVKTTLCHAVLKPSKITAGSSHGEENECFQDLPIRQILKRLHSLVFPQSEHLALSDHFY